VYSNGTTVGTNEKIPPGSIVTVLLDMDEGTLTFEVNGKEQSTVIRDLKSHGQLYLGVLFYSSSRIVALLEPAAAIAKLKAKGVTYVLFQMLYVDTR
jgi:hypothetical protein